jgi:hypothetical protein
VLIHLHFGALSCGRHTSPKFLANFNGLAAAQTKEEKFTTDWSQFRTDLANWDKDFRSCQMAEGILGGPNILLLAN